MKLKVKTTALKQALDCAAVVARNKPIRPILGYVQLSVVKEHGVSITATDIAVEVRTSFGPDDVEIEGDDGHAAIGFAELKSIVSACDAETMTIECDNKSAKITYPGANYKLQLGDVDEFPRLILGRTDDGFQMGCHAICTMAERTTFAASKDMYSFALQGALLVYNINLCYMVCADRSRMACYTYYTYNSFDDGDAEYELLLPIPAVDAISKINKTFIGDSSDDAPTVSVSTAQDAARFTIQGDRDAAVTAWLIEGKHPDFQKLFKPNTKTSWTVDAKMFLHAIKAAQPTVDEETQHIKISIDSGESSIQSQSLYRGSANVRIKGHLEGPPVAIGLNGKLLAECLKHCDDNVTLKINDPDEAFQLYSGEFSSVIMPILTEE